MMLSETPEFQSVVLELIDVYNTWDRMMEGPRTERATIGVGEDDVCVMLFKGRAADIVAVREFLNNRPVVK